MIRSKRKWAFSCDQFTATVTTIRLSAWDAQQYRLGLSADGEDAAVDSLIGAARAWLADVADVTIDGAPVVCDAGQFVEALTPTALVALVEGTTRGESASPPSSPS